MNRDAIDSLCAPLAALTHLECDGLSRVLFTMLTDAGAPVEAFAGRISAGTSRVIHFWLRVGEWTIDYRARMWLGAVPEIPHGVFRAGDFPAVQYDGIAMPMEPLPGYLFAALMKPAPLAVGRATSPASRV